MKTLDEYVPRNAGVGEVARWAAKAPSEDVHVVLKALESAARQKTSALKRESDRIRFARVTVGLIPRTLRLLQKLLNERRKDLDYEVHFSLFCYLDDVLTTKALSGFAPVLLQAVIDYLRTADPKKADAVWMGTDLLSDHWLGDEGADALLEVYGTKRIAAPTKELVREALERCLKRRDASTVVKQRVREALLK
jgi:hypothetical protein